MSEPFGNTEQLPVAWYYENEDIKWVTLYKDVMPNNAIPLYTHPVAEQPSLTDKQIDEMVAILRQQAKEIEELRRIVEGTIKQAFYEDDYHQLKEKFDEQAKEIEQLNFVLKNLTLATNKKINELEEEIEHLKNKVQYWKGLHR